MTIQQCITIVDGYEPNAYTDAQKARWVQECEGRIFTQVFLQQPINDQSQTTQEILALDLALPAPYDRIYPSYLQAMIHYANGEYDRYSSSMQLYNDAWAELNRWFGRDFDISDRNRNRRVTVRIQLENPQTLLTIPPRCAFVAGRIVVKQTVSLSGGGAITVCTGKLWHISSSQLDATMAMMGGMSKGVKMLMGDVGGTELKFGFDFTPNAGEAYLTGVLCMPEEDLLYRSEQVL